MSSSPIKISMENQFQFYFFLYFFSALHNGDRSERILRQFRTALRILIYGTNFKLCDLDYGNLLFFSGAFFFLPQRSGVAFFLERFEFVTQIYQIFWRLEFVLTLGISRIG